MPKLVVAPRIRSFICLNAHPTGCAANVDREIAVAIRNKIAALLAGHPPEVQGAALADLLAFWLAGFEGPNAADVRAMHLAVHLAQVIALVPVNEEMLHAQRRVN